MSANVADTVRPPSPRTAAPSSRRVHRWFFAGAAIFIVATVLVGFLPSSFERVAAAAAGQRAPLSIVLHAHAATMGAWLLLLLAQAMLAASGRLALHRRIGSAAFVLAPLVVIAMTLQMRMPWFEIAAAPPGVVDPAVIAANKIFLANLLPVQLGAIALFALFVGWALAVRNTDPETHKRMMILATFMPLGAAIDRIAARWLPTTFPETYEIEHGYFLLWLAPIVIYDSLKNGRLHRAYAIGLACLAPLMLVTHLLWNSPAWHALAPRIIGIEGW
jgi:hypothetical protein